MERITKIDFVQIINTLEKQAEYSHRTNKLLEEIFEDGSGFPRDGQLLNIIVDLLKLNLNDEEDDISYFLYELDYGKEWKSGMIIYDELDIDLSSAEKLYDHLIWKQTRN